MLDDLDGRQDELAVPLPRSGGASGSRPRSGREFVAPVTLDSPGWQRRYSRFGFAVDAAAVGSWAVFYLLWQDAVASPFVAAVASAVALAAAGRGALRWWLHHLRRRGRALSGILAVGTVDDIAALVEWTRRNPELGWRVAGACTSTGVGSNGANDVAGVPVLGDLDTIGNLAVVGRFDAVAVAPTPGWTVTRLRTLAGDLDGSRTALLADPRLVPHGGPHLRATPVSGLPFLHLVQPTPGGPRRVAESVIDRVGALVLLVLVAPVLAFCALAVRRDGGPALHRRPCVGRGGRIFTLLTFRVTGIGTEALTPVGRVLERYCLDELPQLLNVLGGSMALVGPRPSVQVPGMTGRPAPQRLFVKPGLTGPRLGRGARR